jgi:hypothetical protein
MRRGCPSLPRRSRHRHQRATGARSWNPSTIYSLPFIKLIFSLFQRRFSRFTFLRDTLPPPSPTASVIPTFLPCGTAPAQQRQRPQQSAMDQEIALEGGRLATVDLELREEDAKAAAAACGREIVTQEEEADARLMRMRLRHRRTRRPL